MRKQDYEQLTFFPADFLASLSASREAEKARRTIVTSGRKCCASLTHSGPLGLLVRMLLESSAWRSTIYSLIWKQKTTKQGRSYYQLAASARRTGGTASQSWATPNTMDHLPARSVEGILKMQQGARKGRSRPSNLREQVQPDVALSWPTPCADDATDRTCINPVVTRNGTIRHLNKQGKQSRAGLSAVVKAWATPQAGDYRGPNPNPGAQGTSGRLPQSAHSLPTQVGGLLNPDWVSRLMGFPDGWLDL